MSKIVAQTGFLTLVRQAIRKKENSKFKTAKLRYKN